jgi:hypothetical protein
MLPYVQHTIGKLARILERRRSKIICIPLSTIKSLLKLVKDHMDPQLGKGGDHIPSSCGKTEKPI